MKNRSSFILLLLFLFSNVVFAQGAPLISDNVFKKASQVKTIAKTKASTDENIDIIFYPEGGKSDNVSLSFFESAGIDYIKSRNFISAKIPADKIPLLSQMRGVQSIDLNVKAKALAVSEGKNAINASVFGYNNITGAGIKIAIIDVGFANYTYLQSSGELPSNLISKDFTIGGEPSINAAYEIEPHGSACAEVVYDIAPGAQMYIIKINDNVSLQNAFDYCKAQGVKIASCSIGFSYSFWPDGTGEFANVAVEAFNNNILPVFAAGNEADQSWFGAFSGNSDDFMVFASGKDYLELYLVPLGSVYMMWNDFTLMNKKYTIYMYDSTGNTLLDTSVWSPGNRPSVYVSNNAYAYRNVRIKIKKENTSENVEIRLYFEGIYLNLSDKLSESSLSSPADARESLTVGALSISSWGSGPIDSYSSRGPTRQTAALAQTQKPNISAPSYVSTVSYGSQAFNGTSAATPHVSAAAALLLSLDNSLSVSQLKDKVLSYAQKVATSPDNNYGRGKLVLGTDMISGGSDIGDIVCYPNPSSISKNKHVKITNLPYNAIIDINVYTVTGEFVKSFSASDAKSTNGKRVIEWDLKNESGSQVAPGIYFVTIDTPLNKKKIAKIAVQK